MNTGMMEATRQSVESLSARIAGILRTQEDLSRPTNPRWSVRDTAAHLVGSTDLYTEIALGTLPDVGVFTPEGVSNSNFARIADIPEADPRELATILIAAAERFLEATLGRPDSDPVVYYDQIPLQLVHISGILTGEYVLHGYDIAAACNVPWPIDPGQAALGLFGLGAVFEYLADPETSRGHTGSYLIDLGRDIRMTIRFADGKLSVDPSAGPADCELASDPVTFLMLAMGRISQAQAVALGTVRFNGRNPELAAGFLDKLYSF